VLQENGPTVSPPAGSIVRAEAPADGYFF
jgi:hypothetical protein